MVVGTRIDLRLGVIGVGRIGWLLLRVNWNGKGPIRLDFHLQLRALASLTWHQILQVELLLLLALVAQTDGGAGQQNGSQ